MKAETGLDIQRLGRIKPILQGYVDEKKLAGMVALVARHGRQAYFEAIGQADVERNQAMKTDTIFRIYSMTKPITSTAIMMLLEEGRLHIDTPLSYFAPWFKGCKVLANVNGKTSLEPMQNEITLRHLLTHSAGLSYGSDENLSIDTLYHERIWNAGGFYGLSFEEIMRTIASIPLVYQPGSAWRYSMATDVLGYVVEQVSGKSFATFLKERILDPLGMVDTAFKVATEKAQRFAANYGPDEKGVLTVIDDPATSLYLKEPLSPSGGGGLVSTATDYLRFCQMMLNKGQLDGVRLLGRKTVEWMTMNHLPENGRIDEPGFGFGLGFSVLLDSAAFGTMGSVGLYRWGGAANTKFWIDPQEDLIGILMLQFMPNNTYPVGKDFLNLVYQAIVDEG